MHAHTHAQYSNDTETKGKEWMTRAAHTHVATAVRGLPKTAEMRTINRARDSRRHRKNQLTWSETQPETLMRV